MSKIGKNLLRAAWLSIAGAVVCLGTYPFRERPIPKNLEHFDYNKNRKLARDECFDVIASLVDENYDQKIDFKEENTTGAQLVDGLWKAWGWNNFRSAWELKKALREIKEGIQTKEDWDTSVRSCQD